MPGFEPSRPGVCHPERAYSDPHPLSLVCPAPREDVPDEYGLRGAIVVEDHSPVADPQPEVLATREPPDIERAIIGAETIQRSQDPRADRRVEAPQLLLGGAREAQRSPAAHSAPRPCFTCA